MELPVLPLYQCHKKVRAAKITSVRRYDDGSVLYLDNGSETEVDNAWLARNPKLAVGGYFVHYCENADNYTAYSPAEPFESGYTLAEEEGSTLVSDGGYSTCMDFGAALDALKDGRRVSRAGWNGKGMFVYLVPSNAYPPSTDAAKSYFNGGLVPYNAYLAIKNVNDTVSTWVPSINDVLAEDWGIVE